MKKFLIEFFKGLLYFFKIFVRIIVCALLITLPTKIVVAACVPPILILTAPPSLNIDPTVSVGSTIGSTSMNFGGGTASLDCGLPFYTPNGTYKMFGEGIPNGNLYPTSIPGVAYRAKITGWPGGFNNWWPVTVGYSVSSSTISSGKITVEFVKTGPVLAGTLAPQMMGYVTINDIPFFNLQLGQPVIVAPITPTCTIVQSAITVQLDDTNTIQLSTTGSTSGDKPVNITLACTSAANISVAFSGNVADSANAVFNNLSGSSNANSVGVQLLDANSGFPVPTTAGTYINLGSVSGPTNVPLTARYYALNSNIDGGAVSSIIYASVVYN